MHEHETPSDRFGRFWLLTYRIEGEDGWHLLETAVDRFGLLRRLRQDGIAVADCRQLWRGGRRLAEGETEVPDCHDPCRPDDAGWTYDEQGRCWRAPGEELLPFPGTPQPAEAFSVRFAPPADGSLAVAIETAGQHMKIQASDLYDPFPDLIDWLKDIADGHLPWMIIEQEGRAAELFTFAGDAPDTIRFVAGEVGNEGPRHEQRQVMIDVQVARRTLVAAFYRGLRACAKSADYDVWHWARRTVEDVLRERAPDTEFDRLHLLPAEELERLLPRVTTSGPLGSEPQIQAWLPEEFDRWDAGRRKTFLQELLEEEFNTRCAEDLRNLRSAGLERWLAET